MNKDDGASSRKDNIGPPWKVITAKAIPEAATVKFATNE